MKPVWPPINWAARRNENYAGLLIICRPKSGTAD